MSETVGERLSAKLVSLPYPWPSSEFLAEMSQRVATWLENEESGPTETVRLEGLTVVAARDGSSLVLDITKPAFQTDDRRRLKIQGFADELPGISVQRANPETTRIQLPLDELR